MIEIVPIDSKNNLFYIKNLFPDELIESINKIDPESYEFIRLHLQEQKPRKRLVTKENDVFTKLHIHIKENLEFISQKVNLRLLLNDTAVWYDSQDYTIGIHQDNPGVSAAMQIYLNDIDRTLGTSFFYENDIKNKRYEFEFKPNTGYLMINDKGQWHGMTRSVPLDTYRLSTYTYFQYEINK